MFNEAFRSDSAHSKGLSFYFFTAEFQRAFQS
jgi:hypothetical protein